MDDLAGAPRAVTTPTTDDLDGVRELYASLLRRWNRRDAHSFAAHFTEDGTVVGFDGSEMNGRVAIESELARIFRDHPTGQYVGIVRETRRTANDVVLLRAVAGIVPHGQSELKPELNSIQSLLAVRHGDRWRIAHYHNTPAAFHGRPEVVTALTEELRAVV